MPKQTTYPPNSGSSTQQGGNNASSGQQQQQNSEQSTSNNNIYNSLRYQGPQSAFQSSNTSNALHFFHNQLPKQGGNTNTTSNNNQPSLFNLLDGSTATMASDEMAHYYQRLFSSNNNNNMNATMNAMSLSNVNTPGSSSSNSNNTNPSAFVSPLPPASTPLADSLSYYLEQLGLPNQNKGSLLAPSATTLLNNIPSSTTSTTNQPISKSTSSDKISTLLNNINNNITINNTNLPMTSPTSSSSLSSNSGSGGQHVEETKKKKKKKPIAPESDEDEEMQMEGDESGGLFHPIACVQCRRLHKRCDRKLPACSKCVSRGVNCEYKIPRKKGRTAKPKTSTETDQNKDNASSIPSWEGVSMNPLLELDKISTTTAPQIPDVDVRRISEMNMCIFNTTNPTAGLKPLHSSTTKLLANILSAETPYGNIAKTPEKHLDKRKVLDLYFNIFGNGMPVIERKDFEGYLSSKSNNSKDDDDEIITEGNDIMPNKKEVYAMFLAIKAICEQRTGLSDLAEETMKKAREALSKFFDEHSNFYVSCCYAFMCIYESGCGRLKTAKYYLQSVNFYLDELTEEEQQNLTIYQKNLKKIRSFCKVCSSNDSGVLALLKDWPNVFEKTLGIQIPTEWRTLLEQDLTANNYSTMIKVVETLLHIVRMHLTKTGSERNLKIFDMGSTIVFHGIRLGILSAVNRGKELIEESALKITFGTENELFLFVPPPIVAHVAAAAKVHLHIVKSIEAGDRQNPEVMMVPTVNYGEEARVGTVDYYEILAKDLRALNILAKRYKKVSLFHKTLMQEMEEIINRKHLMSALNLFTSHSLSEGNKQPTDLPQFTQNFSSGTTPSSNNKSTNVTPSSSNSNLPTASSNATNPLSALSNDLFSHYNLSEFSEFQNVKNTKDFFSVIANSKNNKPNPVSSSSSSMNSNPIAEPPTINWQDMINGSGLNLNLGNTFGFGLASPVPNMNTESLQNESFFEPFLDTDEMQEIYSFAYDETLGPFMNNNSDQRVQR